MADSVEGAQNLESEEQEATEDLQEDYSLSGIFNQAAGEDEEPISADDEEESDTPAATVSEDAKYLALQEKLEKLQERQVELETENNIYRSERFRQPAQVVPQSDNEEEIDFDELNKQIAENPAKAFVELFNKYSPKIAKAAETNATKTVAAVNATQTAFRTDQERAISDYGDYWEKNPEFTNLANNYYDQITSESPVVAANGSRYHKGAIYAAMSMAYATLQRQGKLTSKVVPLRENKKPSLNPNLGERSEKGSDGDLFANVPARELAAMKRTAQKMGVSWEDYKSRMAKLAKREPGFGGLK